jgi:hypothetical protein
MQLPSFSGPFAEEVTQRVRRSGEDGVEQFAQDAPTDVDSTVEVKSEVTTNDERTVQVRLNFFYYAQGAAYPLDGVNTVVLRRSDARPIMLAEVFSAPSPALQAALRHASTVAAENGNEDPAETLTTALRDWADWQAGPTGLTFSFDDGQAGSHATGLRQVDVPWSILRPWVRVDAYELLGPA